MINFFVYHPFGQYFNYPFPVRNNSSIGECLARYMIAFRRSKCYFHQLSFVLASGSKNRVRVRVYGIIFMVRVRVRVIIAWHVYALYKKEKSGLCTICTSRQLFPYIGMGDNLISRSFQPLKSKRILK